MAVDKLCLSFGEAVVYRWLKFLACPARLDKVSARVISKMLKSRVFYLRDGNIMVFERYALSGI